MKHIFFDLDGTLLSLDVNRFTEIYIDGLQQAAERGGFEGRVVADAVFKGTYAMVKNDGSRSNEDVFWVAFTQATGITKPDVIGVFDDYYANDFTKAGVAGMPYVGMAEVLEILKDKGYKLYLLTNPLFPISAIQTRAQWAGINLNCFEDVTTYDNSHFCKPNLLYYKEVMERFCLDPKDVLMVGNNVHEDAGIRKLGADCILLSEELINDKKLPIECPLLTHAQFATWAKELPLAE